MQIRNKGSQAETIFVRAQSYVIAPNAVLVLQDRDLVAARRAIKNLPNMELKLASDIAFAKSNLEAVLDPTQNDDSSRGYIVGSKWINNVTQEEWTCFSNVNGLAVWKKIASGAGNLEMGTVLPAAIEARRGKQFLLLGGSQTPDMLYICTKDYQDNYKWNEVPLMDS